MRTYRSSSRAFFLLVAAASLTAVLSCSSQIEEGAADLGVIRQTIYYGSRSPSVTNLTSEQQQAIGYLADEAGEMFCTATLIDRDVAVTARHCVEGTINVEDMRFGLGNPNNPEALIAIHSAPYNGQLDVALLFLMEDAVSLVPGTEPLPFNRVAPEESLVGSQVEAAGYGQTHDGSEGLYFVALELTDIEQEHLVVNGWGERGICFGDSGGPLFIEVDGDEPVIAAVESCGDSSCVDQDFETRLDQAADWIDQQMEAFDPNSDPETGTSGDGDSEEWDEWCIPTGEDGTEGDTNVTWGFTGSTKACPPGTVALCTSSPDQSLPNFMVAMLACGIMLWSVRRWRASAVHHSE